MSTFTHTTTIHACPICGDRVFEDFPGPHPYFGCDKHKETHGSVEAVEIEVGYVPAVFEEYDRNAVIGQNATRMARRAAEIAAKRAADKAERERWDALTPSEQQAEDPDRYELQEAVRGKSTLEAMDIMLKHSWRADKLGL
jgi:hypothetical protein